MPDLLPVIVDGCPECGRHDVQPFAQKADDTDLVSGYACACGHRWIARRRLEALGDGWPMGGAA